MKVYPLSTNSRYWYSKVSNYDYQKQTSKHPTFEGVKGTKIGAGIGFVSGCVVCSMYAAESLSMLPVISSNILLGGTGIGALTGHLIEKNNNNVYKENILKKKNKHKI